MARLVFLGRLADVAGRAGQEWALAGPLDWAGVMAGLPEPLAEAVSQPRVRAALNGAVLADKTALMLCDGDELAFLPPVSGG